MRTTGWMFLGSLLILGCEDKAADSYGKCVEHESKGAYSDADYWCQAAVKDDPNSKSGKLAAEKLTAMKPQIEKAQMERDERRQKETADHKAQQAAADEANAEALKLLKARAKIERSGEDDQCVSDGKPPRGLVITGSTYDNNEAVATSMGCVRTHKYYPQQGHSAMDNYYCCP